MIVGELDRVTPIAEAMSLRSLLKGELVVVPDVGHLPNVEDPLAFNEALASFLGVEVAPVASEAVDADTVAGAEVAPDGPLEAQPEEQPEP